MKRLISTLLAGILFVSMFASCTTSNSGTGSSSSSTSQASSTTEQTSVTSDPAESDFADLSSGFSQNVTLDIPVFERAFEGWNVSDNYYTQWVQKEFGDKYNITVKFMPIARQSQVADYQQLLAARMAPAIIFHYDMPQALTYYSQDVMQPLNLDELAFYAPTYWEKMSDTIQQYGTVDDKNTFIFADRPQSYNSVYIVRKDWVEKVGMKVEDITSLEIFNDMLVKWKEAGLGKNGSRLIANSFIYNYRYRDWPVDTQHHALYSDLNIADFDTIATERYLRDLNYQYNNGLLDPEFYLRDEAGKTNAEFIAGNTGVMHEFVLTANDQVLAQTKTNDPNAEFAALHPNALTPNGLKPQSRAFWPFGMVMGINADISDDQRVALWMYLEWLSQPENLFKFQNGVEGHNYTLDSSGLAIRNTEYTGEFALSQNLNKDYWCLITESAEYSDPDVTMRANIQNGAPAGLEHLIIDNIRFMQETAEYRKPDALYSVVLEKVPEYRSDLNVLWQELYVQCVVVPEAQFDETYEKGKETYRSAGYQAILDEKQAAIDAGNIM